MQLFINIYKYIFENVYILVCMCVFVLCKLKLGSIC